MRPTGYATVSGPTGLKEWDTITCSHCQHIVTFGAKQRPEDLGGHCRLCDKPICKHCVGKGCTPWEKAMERMEAREAARRSYRECA